MLFPCPHQAHFLVIVLDHADDDGDDEIGEGYKDDVFDFKTSYRYDEFNLSLPLLFWNMVYTYMYLQFSTDCLDVGSKWDFLFILFVLFLFCRHNFKQTKSQSTAVKGKIN